MFRFIELFGILLLLWFIINFIRYGLWASSGFEGPGGAVFSMSSKWIKDAMAKKESDENKTKENKTKARK